MFLWKVILLPLLIARQSSWFMMVLWDYLSQNYTKIERSIYLSSMTKFVVLQSNPSVLWPAASPPLAELGLSPRAGESACQSSVKPYGSCEWHTVIDGKLGHSQSCWVRHAVRPRRWIENFDILEVICMSINHNFDKGKKPTWKVPEILILSQSTTLSLLGRIKHLHVLHHRCWLRDSTIATLTILKRIPT